MKKTRAVIEGAAVEYLGKIIFIQQDFNAIFSYELKSKKVSFIKMLDTEKKHKPYRCAYRYGTYVWFLPWELDKLLRLDLMTYELMYYEVPHDNERKFRIEEYCRSYPSFNVFSAVKITEELLFVVTVNWDSPFLLNMRSGEIITYKGIVDFGNEFFWSAANYKDDIYMIPYDGNRMLKLNYKTGNVKNVAWPYGKAAYCGMTVYDDKIWFSPFKSRNLLLYDIEKNVYNEIDTHNKSDDDSFHDIFFDNGKVWLIPWRANYILQYDVEDDEWNVIQKNPKICFDYKTELRTIESMDKLIFVTCRTGFVSIYDRDTASFINYELLFDIEKIREMFSSNIDLFKCSFESYIKKNIIMENVIDLKLLLKLL